MIDLKHIVKKLEMIRPDEGYSARSRQVILSSQRSAPRLGLAEFINNTLQYGASLALMSVMIMLIVGGFGIAKLLSPLQLGSLDAKSLRAEAHAIDIQIELSNLSYPENAAASTEATAIATRAGTLPIDQDELKEKAKELGIAATASSSEDEIGIEEALDILSR